jgi:hypothetical protein
MGSQDSGIDARGATEIIRVEDDVHGSTARLAKNTEPEPGSQTPRQALTNDARPRRTGRERASDSGTELKCAPRTIEAKGISDRCILAEKPLEYKTIAIKSMTFGRIAGKNAAAEKPWGTNV